MSDPLDRLFRAARTLPPEPGALPFGFTTRALALAREVRAAHDAALLSLSWRAATCACLAAGLAGAASYRELEQLTAFFGTELGWMHSATQLALQ